MSHSEPATKPARVQHESAVLRKRLMEPQTVPETGLQTVPETVPETVLAAHAPLPWLSGAGGCAYP